MPRGTVPHRTRSPYGWWIASYLERFEYDDEDRSNLNRRCLAWENTILVKAQSREQAWQKAVAQGRLSEGNRGTNDATGRMGTWRFEGLTSLLPVYEKLDDGAELLWEEHSGRSVRSIRALAKKKAELGVFDDSARRPASPKSRRSNNEMQLTRSATASRRGPRS